MRATLINMGRDLKHGGQVTSYVTAFLTRAIAMLSFFGDVVSPDLRWAACTMGIGLLVLRSATSRDNRVSAETCDEMPPLDVRIHYVRPPAPAESIVLELRVTGRIHPPDRI